VRWHGDCVTQEPCQKSWHERRMHASPMPGDPRALTQGAGTGSGAPPFGGRNDRAKSAGDPHGGGRWQDRGAREPGTAPCFIISARDDRHRACVPRAFRASFFGMVLASRNPRANALLAWFLRHALPVPTFPRSWHGSCVSHFLAWFLRVSFLGMVLAWDSPPPFWAWFLRGTRHHLFGHGSCVSHFLAWFLRASFLGMVLACLISWHGSCVLHFLAWELRQIFRCMATEHASRPNRPSGNGKVAPPIPIVALRPS